MAKGFRIATRGSGWAVVDDDDTRVSRIAPRRDDLLPELRRIEATAARLPGIAVRATRLGWAVYADGERTSPVFATEDRALEVAAARVARRSAPRACLCCGGLAGLPGGGAFLCPDCRQRGTVDDVPLSLGRI
jgi:hypothetical protein